MGVCFDKDLTGFENLLGLNTSRTRRVINFVFAVSVVGGYYYIMAPCHPDLPAAGRPLGGISKKNDRVGTLSSQISKGCGGIGALGVCFDKDLTGF